MSKTARRARIAAVIELLCDRFPQTFSRRSPQPLKVGVYADVWPYSAMPSNPAACNLRSGLTRATPAIYAPWQRERAALVLMASLPAL